ncbi:MAG: sulfite exporter TauE/SafE family protein [Pseudomonadota bacterium]
MLTLDLAFFALAIPATLFAGISKGGFGSGAAFAAGTILALGVDPGVALGVMLPLLMLMDVAGLKAYWRKWDWSEVRLIIYAGLPGVALGAALYQVANADVFRLLIGGISLAFVAYQILLRGGYIPKPARPMGPKAAMVTGVAAGFTSFVSHAGGPPVAVYLLSRGLDKLTYQAGTVLIFWAINVMKFVPYSFLGIFTWQTLLADLLLAPVALLGTWLGVRAHHMISERAFFGVTYVLLTLTGSKLIFDALT